MKTLVSVTLFFVHSRHFSAISRQLPKEEIANQINPLFTRALKTYKAINQAYPSKIFFYR